MTSTAVVPTPISLSASDAPPFVLAAATVTGDPDAAAELTALLRTRTGGTVDLSAGATAAPAIDLRIIPGGAAEGYSISADAASVVVTAHDAAGLFYGVQTLGQLAAHDGAQWILPAVAVQDAPRFAYRGVMLDVARHFLPIETVTAYIDRAAGLKFNVLHLHLTDDQGWRLALRSRPLLTEHGSATGVGGDGGGFYSREDYRAIVEYAASRHMTVVPEIDVPGHTHAVGLAYPELVEEPVLSESVLDAVRQFGGEPPTSGRAYDGLAVGFSSLRIHDERTYDFLADVFGELASLTPGPYLHLGGDEAHGTAPEDFSDFIERASDIVADLGKTPIAWHEAGVAPGLNAEALGQYWGFVTPTDGMDDAARSFARVILSPADAVYLDMKPHSDTDLGLTWANGPTSVRRAYSWEPADVIDGLDEDDILGVEAPLWTETIRSLADIDRMAFPRIAAAAEAAWSPRTGTNALRTWESFRDRVGALAPLWTTLGIGFDRSAEIAWSSTR